MTEPRIVEEEPADGAAGWIAALGLERGPGGHVRTYPGSAGALTYVLLTPDAPRRAGHANEHLYFHHAGAALHRHGEAAERSAAPLLGQPGRLQVGLERGEGLELRSGSWALISEAVIPGPAGEGPWAPDRWQPAIDEPASSGANLVARLGLAPHVEGGYFRELWAARAWVDTAAGPRPLASTIYYLLTTDAPLGRFHRNTSDITHLLHSGGPIVYDLISPAGEWRQVVLGRDLAGGQVLSFTCPGGWWKSSHLPAGIAAGLISELVAPGFDYADHQIADVALFERLFPRLRARWAGRVRGSEDARRSTPDP